MKEVDCCTSIDGENFMSDLTDGYKADAETAGPFKRGLAYIEARKARQRAEHAGDFRDYDATDTVNLS